MCQVIIRFSRSNALTLVDIANKLQYMIQFLFHYFVCLFIKLKYAEETNICITLLAFRLIHVSLRSPPKPREPQKWQGVFEKFPFWPHLCRPHIQHSENCSLNLLLLQLQFAYGCNSLKLVIKTPKIERSDPVGHPATILLFSETEQSYKIMEVTRPI